MYEYEKFIRRQERYARTSNILLWGFVIMLMSILAWASIKN